MTTGILYDRYQGNAKCASFAKREISFIFGKYWWDKQYWMIIQYQLRIRFSWLVLGFYIHNGTLKAFYSLRIYLFLLLLFILHSDNYVLHVQIFLLMLAKNRWTFRCLMPLHVLIGYTWITGELFFITDRKSGYWNLYKWVSSVL